MENSKLKIKYGSIEFEIESDPETIEKERKAFLETLPSIAYMAKNQKLDSECVSTIDTTEIKGIAMNDSNQYSSINQFMNEKGFNTDIDKCLAVIYYMNKIESIDSVSTISVKDRMKTAKLPIPKSISVAFNGLTTKGYIQPIPVEGESLTNYYIVDLGIEYIENYIKKEKKNAVRKPKQGNNTIESKYSFLTKEMMNLEQYPDYYKLSTTKDKIMLIMYIIHKINQGEYFSLNDLKYIISNIFNDRLTDDAIKGVFRNKSTAKYFDKRKIENNNKMYEYKMIQSGFTYIEDNIISPVS